MPITFSSYAGMDVGRDNGLVVDLAYEDKAPYAFTGKVKNGTYFIKGIAMGDANAIKHVDDLPFFFGKRRK